SHELYTPSELYKTIIIRSDEPIDFLTCIEEHSYPPHLNRKIYWNLPDTSDWGYSAKSSIAHKYSFDSIGRVVEYYYQGSLISGQFPLTYRLEYASQNSSMITRIDDWFNKETYNIAYYDNGSVKQIEKWDSTGKIVELLSITSPD
ncbi:MAG: hypothetical protein HWE14_06940, partial [Flavobacteriia bacterium]|nr:hypothetical protein [Flavobacteriia bacterium]